MELTASKPAAGVPGDLTVTFLSEGEQTASSVMDRLTAFLRGATESLDLAVYDMRLSDRLKQQFQSALNECASRNVRIRICYDGDKPVNPDLAAGQDPAPPGTGAFVQSLGFAWRRIAGLKLMHHKFIVRDAASIWTGSTNMTDDAFTLMENNILEITSTQLARSYATDFQELWDARNFEKSGDIATSAVPLSYSGQLGTARVLFSPGCGLAIDTEVARRVGAARRRVRICSLLLNSGTLISALLEALNKKTAMIDGIYDQTQMSDVFRQWQQVPQNRWKPPAVQELIARANLVGKKSTPYSPTARHDYMHNKILVVDDTVITGSYNFSRSAQFNAENILFIENAALSETYSAYIDHLVEKYGGGGSATASHSL